MKALILAAGRGSRMQHLTGERPKCFVELHGSMLLDWQLKALRTAGINDIAIGTGYRNDSFTRTDVTYIHNERWSETNMVATLARAKHWLESDVCIVSYSDIVFKAEAVERLTQSRGDIAITYDTEWLSQWQARFGDPLRDAETFRLNSDGTVREIGKRPRSLDEIEGQYMGLLKFTPAGWLQIERHLNDVDVDRLDMTTLLNGLVERGHEIFAVAVAGGWFEIDSPRDLEVASLRWRS